MGHSPSLLAELRAIDAEIVHIDESFTVLNHPQDTSATVQELQEFFREKAQDLRSVLRTDVDVARCALAKYVEKLVLTPKGRP